MVPEVGLYAHAVFERRGKQAIWICVAQVVLGEKRQLAEILNALDVAGLNAFLLHFFAVIRDTVPDMLHLFDEALVLPREYLVA